MVLMALNFCQIPLSTTELATLKHMKKLMYNVVTTLALSFFDCIFFIHVGNKDNHKSLNKFEFQLDSTRTAELSAIEHLEKSP